MKITIDKNEWDDLDAKLAALPAKALDFGTKAMKEAATEMDRVYRDHLAHQGRPGGELPELSEVTKHLYRQVGEPDGSGIRNHIRISYANSKTIFVATFGILEGKPTEIAIVQDKGALIYVTSEQRSFLAEHGIHLRSSTTHLYVPGRHSWGKSLEKTNKFLKAKLEKFWEINKA